MVSRRLAIVEGITVHDPSAMACMGSRAVRLYVAKIASSAAGWQRHLNVTVKR